MSEALRQQLELLPDYLSRHLLLSITALSIGVGLSLPLAVLVTRLRWLRAPVLGLASAVQTVPSLALLALMVPLLRMIGFVPAALALILYSMLPIIRNTVTGIEGVDPRVIEAGRGLGMTGWQLLRLVQLPLAMPVIIAGVRTATVWVVGIATLSTPVGATSLGNYIFSGLQTQNHVAVLVGCGAAASLALLLDGIIRVLEVAAARRSRPLLIIAGALALLIFIGGLLPLVLQSRPSESRMVIGAKTFTEQYILAHLISDRLGDAGIDARRLESLGSTILFEALAEGQVDCYVDYTGTIWSNRMGRDDRASSEVVLHDVAAWLKREHGVTCLGSLGFENTYALAMPGETARRLGIATIDDLVAHAPDMRVGGDYELFGRPEWGTLEEAYGIRFAREVSMDASLMYSAVADGELDVIAAFSTDGRIAAHDLVVLEDPRGAFPPYDAILLLSRDAATDPAVVEALTPLCDSISDERMRHANMLVDVEGASVGAAAAHLAP